MIKSLFDIVDIIFFLAELYMVSINVFIPKIVSRRRIFGYTFCIIFIVSISCINSIIFRVIIQFCGVVLFIHMLFMGAIKSKIAISAFLIILISLLNEFLYTILLIGGKYLSDGTFSINDDYYYLLSSAFIFIIVWILSKKQLLRYLRLVGFKYLLFFCSVLCVNSFVIIANGHQLIDTIKIRRQWVLINSYFILVLGMFIQIGLMIALLISRNVYREKEYLAAKYLEEQKLHYEYLENRELQTKKFRHDIKNHLLIVNDLIHKKQYKECEAYLEETSIRIDRFSYKISVNNGIADAIVNKFYMEAEQKGIALHVKGHLPSPCNLSAFDICTIISNLLSNAIEAEVASRGNDVYVEFRYTDTDIMMEVKNNFEQDLEQRSGVFFTTKEDKANHGFGLANVKECVQKNGGQITISTDNHVFKVLVCVNNGE